MILELTLNMNVAASSAKRMRPLGFQQRVRFNESLDTKVVIETRLRLRLLGESGGSAAKNISPRHSVALVNLRSECFEARRIIV